MAGVVGAGPTRRAAVRPRPSLARLVLHVDTAFELLLGAVLVSSPATSLYAAMKLPAIVSKPVVIVFGAALLPIALLLWRATRSDGPTRAFLRLLAGLNGVTAVAAAAWVLVARGQFGRLGAGVVLASAAVLALLAIVEARSHSEQCA